MFYFLSSPVVSFILWNVIVLLSVVVLYPVTNYIHWLVMLGSSRWLILFLEISSHGKALLFMHYCGFKFIIRSLELCCAEMSHHIIFQKSWAHNHTLWKPQVSCNSQCANIFHSVRHIMWHNDCMVDKRLQGCDTLLTGLSWTAATRTVGGHKLFYYVSAKVTILHISVVV